MKNSVTATLWLLGVHVDGILRRISAFWLEKQPPGASCNAFEHPPFAFGLMNSRERHRRVNLHISSDWIRMCVASIQGPAKEKGIPTLV
jgi:hypothetical protein